MELQDARKLLKIDTALIEQECAEQAELQERISSNYAHACSKRDACKLQVDQTTALCSEALRTQRDEAGKPYTETRIALLLNNEDDVVEAKKLYIQAVEQAQFWAGMQEAFYTRNYMLTNLVNMQIKTGAVSDASTKLYNDRLDNLAQERARRE